MIRGKPLEKKLNYDGYILKNGLITESGFIIKGSGTSSLFVFLSWKDTIVK